jgi:hypothetical protein
MALGVSSCVVLCSRAPYVCKCFLTLFFHSTPRELDEFNVKLIMALVHVYFG